MSCAQLFKSGSGEYEVVASHNLGGSDGLIDLHYIIIGYFSLPDWYCKGNEQPTSENARCMDSEEYIVITYKFEDIPPECLVAENKIARKNHCLNVLGRDLSLSLLLNSGLLDSSLTDQNFGRGYITFIAPFSADVWVRIPHESDSSCLSTLGSTIVMARVDNGQLIVKDQFSSFDRESKGFSSDVLHFLQFKKSIKGNGAFQLEGLTGTFTENATSSGQVSPVLDIHLSTSEQGSAQFTFSSDLNVKVKKISVLLTDGKESCFFSLSFVTKRGPWRSSKLAGCSIATWVSRGSSKGPLLEILLRNLLLHANVAENKLEGSVAGDLLVNYNNISKVETSFFHIDSSYDLGIVLHMHGFKPSSLKFLSKFNGTKFSLAKTITFDPTLNDGTISATVEKVMVAFSGAREICIFVPYLLYNCTGFPLIVSDCTKEMKRYGCIIPSCYDLGEQDILIGRKDGLGLLSSSQDHRILLIV
ncbi:vacuolar protein sorting-associated protein, putative [Actinidia rufa]|uniref:Vacuolar protein sorting-associated protein, putative n=1 Tax=Actinidia rufa TaxID=165716 RepID=A0A7J0F280_9ERIC|nr:vacuolar protein sorting-associated protein, putative [Actinidia rufa]